MVMEAATLSGPHRKCTVVPVQKSLSLPSYARASGEGIDHRLIFAALEQKERVRRRSRIFAPRKEKCARQTNLFCLPIPSSGAKCRETSFSSDTSCSSLEYQKTSPIPSKKKDKDIPTTNSLEKHIPEKESIAKRGPPANETTTTIQPENKPKLPNRTAQNAGDWDANLSSQKVSDYRKFQRSPVDTLKVVGSSDSMDRSSRSSSDSLSRKERMVALKARVEAAREKYGHSSSSEEETNSNSVLARFNSDGVIHRSVREVKSRSYLREKRLRRRSQDEISIKKIHRNQNLSIAINPEGNELKLDIEKASIIQDSSNHLEVKTDFSPSPNFPDLVRKNYFSDFPNKENAAHFVQARIRYIEDEERKRRSGSDFREKFGFQSPDILENSSPASTERRHPFEKLNGSSNTAYEIKPSNFESVMRSSPIPRSSQAPTPPPRSPKSMTFVNKAIMQHQNAYLLNQESSLERKKAFLSNVPAVSYSQIFDKYASKNEFASGDAKFAASESPNTTADKQKIRELANNRRKTCGNFDFIDTEVLNELCSIGNSLNSTNSNLVANKKFSSVMQIKKTDGKGYFSSSETPYGPFEDDTRNKLWKSKWQENEQRKEYMFNSLESKKKSSPPSWLKWRSPKTDSCLCRLFPDNKLSCSCKSKLAENKPMYPKSVDNSLENFNLFNSMDVTSLSAQYSSNRFSKSNTNASSKDSTLEATKNLTFKSLLQTPCGNISNGDNNCKNEYKEKLSASANLDSAMEELENVYQSLKMSSDNLSDRNSVLNISVSDDDVKFPKPKNKDSVELDSRFNRRSSVCETGLGTSKSSLFNFNKSPLLPITKNTPSLANDKPSEINQFSIDELFNDLTQQLDFEQKLLKEPRDSRNHQPKIPLQVNSPKRLNNPSPQVSIHKEFYENLCKSNQEQSSPKSSKTRNPICENGTDGPKDPLTKKKFKAVRSLSENISYLMSAVRPNSPTNKNAISNGNSKNTPAEQSSPKYYERVLPDPPKSDLKQDTSFKQSDLLPKLEESNLNSKRDEIRHIRVSMDTDVCQSKPIASLSTFSDTKQYPSLSSAVSSSQPFTKPEVLKPCLPEQNFDSEETREVLDETGLEKLLNSLLGEVPENQSSLSQSKDLGPATPPPIVPGEMSVMQHLDVIRLKPVPS